MQCALVILSSVACPALQYFFSHHLTKIKIVGKNVAEHKTCFDFIHNFCMKHFSFKEELSEIRLKIHAKYPQVLPDCNETRIFSTGF